MWVSLVQSAERPYSRAGASPREAENFHLRTAASAHAHESQSALPDTLFYGFQTCLASLYNCVSQISLISYCSAPLVETDKYTGFVSLFPKTIQKPSKPSGLFISTQFHVPVTIPKDFFWTWFSNLLFQLIPYNMVPFSPSHIRPSPSLT